MLLTVVKNNNQLQTEAALSAIFSVNKISQYLQRNFNYGPIQQHLVFGGKPAYRFCGFVAPCCTSR